MPKTRLDLLLVERGLAESRAQAQRLIMAGQVRLAGQMVLKPATSVAADAEVQVEQAPPFVSRGGEKLQAALEGFAIDPAGLVCADVGASTGGFSDCLLQHGAKRVFAIDVGQGILHWKLRQDPRVVVLERTNARYLSHLPEPVQLVTIDASFISLKLLLPVVKGWFPTSPPPPTLTSPPAPPLKGRRDGREVLALIKPQFEAGRTEVRHGQGVIRDPAVHRQVLLDVLSFAREQSYGLRGLLRSPLLGPKGNVEFLAWLSFPASESEDLAVLVEAVVPSE